MLVALHIIAMKEWLHHNYNYSRNRPNTIPKCYRVMVQGPSGTGKTFCICTNQNITRNLTDSMNTDLASCFTGTASSLIGGSTHARQFCLPFGKKAKPPPADFNFRTIDETVAFYRKMSKAIHVTFDEGSMDSCSTWAHIVHRCHKGRQPIPNITSDNLPYKMVRPEVAKRTMGNCLQRKGGATRRRQIPTKTRIRYC